MAWIYFLLLLLTDIIGLGLAAFMLPGLWLMLAGAAVYAWLTHGYYLGFKTLIALLIMAFGAEISEFYFGGAGAKKAGASPWGMIGGLIGAIVGGITLSGLVPIPILGTIIGICLGTFTGAFTVELILGQPLSQSAAIGLGAAKGRLTGIAGKLTIGIVMLLISFAAALPFHLHHPARTTTATTVPATPASR
jgi:uncharacterized protein YqgC (DUF456 family)